MIILVAETGESFELDGSQAPSTIDRDQVASLSGVPIKDQLFFKSHLKEDDPASPIFLFNRQRLVQNSPPPCQQMLPTNVEPVLPEAPLAAMLNNQSGFWDDTAAGALPSYEAQFRYNFQKGNALLTASRNKLDACKRLVGEIQVQELALSTVRSSMENTHRILARKFSDSMSEFVRMRQQHEDVLAGFESDVERLSACKLHPVLRSETRHCLADLVRESSLTSSNQECKADQENLLVMVSDLENSYEDSIPRIEEFLRLPSRINLQELKEKVESYSEFPQLQSVILESLKEDVISVKRIMEDFSRGKRVNAQDVSLGLGAKHDVQINSQLPEMEKYDYQLGNLLKLMVKRKNEMSLCVHNRMQSTSVLQLAMNGLRLKMIELRTAMTRQIEKFEVLKLARRIGSSYKACLAEVVRRRAFLRLYFAQANQLAEGMARKRDREMARREEFVRHHSVLPRVLLRDMGLLDTPSQCVVDISPFDAGLMNLDLSDIERYSPRCSPGVMRLDEDPEEEVSSDVSFGGEEMLEVENARLKAQLASSIALMSSLDPGFQPECLGDPDDYDQLKFYGRGSVSVVERTREALRLKDEHAKHLKRIIDEKQAQCDSYEDRIRELEQRLKEQAEQAEQSSRFESTETHSFEALSEASGITSGVTCEPQTGRAEDEDVKKCIGDGENDQVASGGEDQAQLSRSDAEQEIELGRALEVLRESQVNATSLEKKLHDTQEFLRENQMNAADLERKLHEAREEARRHKSTADRKATEYTVLRATSVRQLGLLERVKICLVSKMGNGAGVTESLQALSASLLKCDAGDEVIQTLITVIIALFRQQAERIAEAQGFKTQLKKEAEEKADMAKSLVARIKVEKQVL